MGIQAKSAWLLITEEAADAGVTELRILPVCVCSCSSLAPVCMSPSVSFCVPSLHSISLCLYFSLRIPRFLFMWASVPDPLLSCPLCSRPFVSHFQAPAMEPPFLSAFSRRLKNFCLISMQKIQKTLQICLSMFPIQTLRREQGREPTSPFRCLPQQMSSLSFGRMWKQLQL
ncbi:hypothetical protein HJG60_011540 [Phyllostomus discolor]|uniref:Uncharacterized protein n=1 Tax=Phyllostomus discolor TaxID=89673 RepID=A0A833ZVZ9_9CHIR|nr:hypothetical protein HJG60_011540 [Phyllostomus discolor]